MLTWGYGITTGRVLACIQLDVNEVISFIKITAKVLVKKSPRTSEFRYYLKLEIRNTDHKVSLQCYSSSGHRRISVDHTTGTFLKTLPRVPHIRSA